MYTTILLLLKKFWKELAIVIIIAGLSYKAYDYVYDKATIEANKQCTKTMKEYTDKLDIRISELVIASKDASAISKERAEALKQDLDKLFKLTKNKPLTIIKEGKCIPSPVFIETYNTAIDRINLK